MSEYLLRTNNVLSECETHLALTNTRGTAIESYLTQHILILFCADMQQEIYRITDERAKSLRNNGVREYLSNSSQHLLRSANLGKIVEYVRHFGLAARTKYESMLEETDTAPYANAVANRVKVAHRHGAQVSFSELKKAVAVAKLVLQAIEAALDEAFSVTPSE